MRKRRVVNIGSNRIGLLFEKLNASGHGRKSQYVRSHVCRVNEHVQEKIETPKKEDCTLYKAIRKEGLADTGIERQEGSRQSMLAEISSVVF